ncbi:IS630 transposase-related protein [Synechococcus sp. PCC 6312]|uniref:IS630 transposase-related protein n=1 Tax=Synechococcus sp. (strain ATCC 27167 / PCC 6312) TaxID=195253 RepID=UPI0002D3D7D3|nr:IS630 transposase-related protein [Synechococcus sp. PCC 6312]
MLLTLMVMSYSLDLRQRVIAYFQQGGQVTQASKIFQVGRSTIYRWLGRDNLAPTVVTRRPRKLDWSALEADVRAYP